MGHLAYIVSVFLSLRRNSVSPCECGFQCPNQFGVSRLVGSDVVLSDGAEDLRGGANCPAARGACARSDFLYRKAFLDLCVRVRVLSTLFLVFFAFFGGRLCVLGF